MLAIVLDGPSDPGELATRRIPVPTPGPNEALVQVEAAAVNRSDVLNVAGLPVTTYPRVPGRDFAGTVVEGPPSLRGTRVWGTGSGDLGFGRDGSHAEYLALPAASVVPVPESMTIAEAAVSGLAYFAAADGFEQAGLDRGETVLVTGAAGGVGTAACALVGWRGASLIAAVKDEAEAELVYSRFPQAEVLVTATPLASEVMRVTADGGANVVFDTVGNALFTECIEALAPGGRMTVLTAQPNSCEFDLLGFYRRGARLIGLNSGRHDSAWAAGLLRDLLPGFERGELVPLSPGDEFDLGDCVAAYAGVAASTTSRVVLRPRRA